MRDTSDIPRDCFIPEYDDLSPETLPRPETPLPDDSRTLRRTASYASIETVHPRANKGIRRRITEIAQGLKHTSVKKKTDDPSTQDVPKTVTHGLTWDSENVPVRKASKYERKAADALRRSLRRAEERSILAVLDRLYNGIPSAPSTTLLCKSDSIPDHTFLPEDELFCKDGGLSELPGARVIPESEDIPHQLLVLKADVKDVKLEIRPSESDVTIWDGLQVSQHVFKCRLYLRCMTHPYDGVCVPDVSHIDMTCNTHPAGSRYARPPVLQATYEGRSSNTKRDPSPNVNLETGIKIDKFWRTMLDDRGTWGWYKEVFVPLSPRLFDKMEYREFKLVGQVSVGESCIVADLTFGISMLLRGVDMD